MSLEADDRRRGRCFDLRRCAACDRRRGTGSGTCWARLDLRGADVRATSSGGTIAGVEEKLRALRPALHQCYVESLRRSQDNAIGTVILTTTFDANGGPKGTRLDPEKDLIITPAFATCLTTTFDAATFEVHPDQPKGAVTFALPLELDQIDDVKYKMIRLINGDFGDGPFDAGPPPKTKVRLRDFSSTVPVARLERSARNVANAIGGCANRDSPAAVVGNLTVTISLTPDGHREVKASPPLLVPGCHDNVQRVSFDHPATNAKVTVVLSLVAATPQL